MLVRSASSAPSTGSATEALCLLVWRDGVFDLASRQKVSSVSVAFERRGRRCAGRVRLVARSQPGALAPNASSIDEDDEAELDGLHIVVGDFDRRRLGYAAAIVVDGIRFQLKTGQLIERPRRLAEAPDDWL